MGNLRPVLLMGMVFLAYLLWVEWQKDYGQPPVSPVTQSTEQAPGQGIPSAPTPAADDLPIPGEVGLPSQDQAGVPALETPDVSAQQPVITVTTDVLEVAIDPVGGTVVTAKLLNYPIELKQPEIKVSLLTRQGNELFIAQSGLLSRQSAPNHTTLYSSSSMSYTLSEGADELVVPLTWQSEDGVSVTKTLIFKRNSYEIDVRHTLKNNSAQPWSGSRYAQLQKAVPLDEEGASFTNPGSYSFRGIGFYNPEDKFDNQYFRTALCPSSR